MPNEVLTPERPTGLFSVIVRWLDRRLNPPPKPPTPEPKPLVPGNCECGHSHCCHIGGTGACTVGYPPDDEWKDGASCACKTYIFDPDSDDDDEDEPTVPTPSSDELERMIR